MSKKSQKKPQAKKPLTPQAVTSTPVNFGFEEMLGELEAIVADAQTRQSEEEAA
ncbi:MULTISPECIES: hypothetical protein [Pseudocitrobacter]|uniref:Cytoplasmic protein n=1 Tax=Pseudocitrobacter faecalis TaxID=1398493 RepID=A0ABX9FUW8_9ENTR|nr:MULTISPECIES: hypothetical protein [Pseudocitrobacter]RBP08399.1 hypothetical protein DFQ50_109166 [Pseudocitrobacter faecalis]UYW73637.1 hypothetical protein OFY05_20280 [Pseudocitrobacter faecalis]GHD96155.1 hypothetical protein GCM10011445_34380 [Pseudocitrobacter faecalis]